MSQGTAGAYQQRLTELQRQPRTWLVTGVAGFIGSHLLETLLEHGQHVVGLDDFSTGRPRNLEAVRAAVGDHAWDRFHFIEGDVADLDTCRRSVTGADIVLHQAALGSVPRSLEDPLRTNRANIDGFLTLLVAARDEGIRRFVYAASSSTYGDHPALPKVEDAIGKPLSPYAVTKYVDELYAGVFALHYGMEVIGLRYFNVFGPRQDPAGAYAAVIPKWIHLLKNGEPCTIHGQGDTSRDFCYVANAVQANILAATTADADATDQVYNVAVGDRTTLDQLYRLIRDGLAAKLHWPALAQLEAEHGPYRQGDVKHSQADIGKARALLGYQPSHTVAEGLDVTLDAFLAEAG